MDTREHRGFADCGDDDRCGAPPTGWLVPSQSSPNISYKVESSDHPKDRHAWPILDGLVCTCPDYELRGQACKHIIAVELDGQAGDRPQ